MWFLSPDWTLTDKNFFFETKKSLDMIWNLYCSCYWSLMRCYLCLFLAMGNGMLVISAMNNHHS